MVYKTTPNKTEVIKGGGLRPFHPLIEILITRSLQQARGSGGMLIEINSSALSGYFKENQKQKLFYSSHQEYMYTFHYMLLFT